MISTRGVYNNLNESTYEYTYNGITYFFSSKVYRDKFIERLENFIEIESDKLSVKFKTKVDGDNIFAIKFYTIIEKRGFRIIIDGKEYNENIPIYLSLNMC